MSVPFRLWLGLLVACCCLLHPATDVAAGQEKLGSTALFKRYAPGVVLLISKDSIGSGIVISETEILTNWHVVGRNKRMVVAFKPLQEGAPLDPDKFVVGDVIRKAEGKDLALVRVKRMPGYVSPIPLGVPDELEIGADVHAIGHPQGEIWTYTKGVISQLRNEFEWQAGPKQRFKADVIQTQTPINPGNSGGPLLSERGTLVGVNSFKTKGAEGMNFAVALSEVLRFLNASEKPAQGSKKEGGKTQRRAEEGKDAPAVPELAFQGRDKADAGYLRVFAVKGDTGNSRAYFYPDDQEKPAFCFETREGLTTAVIMDLDRDGKWEYSVRDQDGNGKFDTVGLHPDGKLKPSSTVSFKDKKVPPKVREVLPGQVPEPGPLMAGSPSFECSRAKTLTQQTICGSDTLADLDVTVTALYSRVLQKQPAMREQVTAGQEEWRKGTESQCAGDDIAACLESRYKQRVIYLNVLMLQ